MFSALRDLSQSFGVVGTAWSLTGGFRFRGSLGGLGLKWVEVYAGSSESCLKGFWGVSHIFLYFPGGGVNGLKLALVI